MVSDLNVTTFAKVIDLSLSDYIIAHRYIKKAGLRRLSSHRHMKVPSAHPLLLSSSHKIERLITGTINDGSRHI